MIAFWLIGLAVWAMCGYIAAGGTHAYFTEYPTGKYLRSLPEFAHMCREDAWFAALFAPLGPIALVIVTATSGGFIYGITWDWPLHLFEDPNAHGYVTEKE